MRAFGDRGLQVDTWSPPLDGDTVCSPPSLDGVELVVVLGGDGALMQVVRALGYPRVPFYGVNYGQVGFLMNTQRPPAELAELLSGGEPLSTISYPILEAHQTLASGEQRHDRAFNDFVFERASGHTVHLQIHIDGVLLNRYSGDGLIVATPGGSSAYSLAAGGPVVHDAVEGMIITPLYPHRPVQFHSLQFPVLLPLKSQIRVVADRTDKRPVRFVADGVTLGPVAEVEIAHKNVRVDVLREARYHFIDSLVQRIIGRQPVDGGGPEGR